MQDAYQKQELRKCSNKAEKKNILQTHKIELEKLLNQYQFELENYKSVPDQFVGREEKTTPARKVTSVNEIEEQEARNDDKEG